MGNCGILCALPIGGQTRLGLTKETALNRKTNTRTRRDSAPEWFTCAHCGQAVVPETYGTAHRNHCPWCLWSRHLDEEPGDRASDCRGGMEPVAVWVRQGGEWAVIHRCRSCGIFHSNRIAGDDNEVLLLSLALRPLTLPAFPLDRLKGQSTETA